MPDCHLRVRETKTKIKKSTKTHQSKKPIKLFTFHFLFHKESSCQAKNKLSMSKLIFYNPKSQTAKVGNAADKTYLSNTQVLFILWGTFDWQFGDGEERLITHTNKRWKTTLPFITSRIVRYDVSDRHVWSVIQSTLLFEYECRLIFNNAACNYHIKQVECLYTNLMFCILQLSLERIIFTNTYSKKGENKVIFGLLFHVSEFPFITSMNYKVVIGSEPLRIITNLITIKSSSHK